MKNEEFWKKRVEMYGHTGWADTSIYAFDQDIRLNIVSSLIEQNIPGGGIKSLLDFGCGTGDFTRCLLPKFNKIVMYDPCREALCAELLQHEKINGMSDIDDLKELSVQYDAILSITVLQHIMEDDELMDRLDFIRDSMKEHGVFLVMESFDPNVKAEYERSWDCETFCGIMKNSGFELVEAHNFYNVADSEIFKHYAKRWDVRVLKKASQIFRSNADHSLLRKIASRYNGNIHDFIEPFTYDNGSKFMLYKKREG